MHVGELEERAAESCTYRAMGCNDGEGPHSDRVASRTRWQLVTFYGKSGGESVGVVDLLAIRKDHGEPVRGIRRENALQIILIQVKGGSAAQPTLADATWKNGNAVRFFRLRRASAIQPWTEITNLDSVFR